MVEKTPALKGKDSKGRKNVQGTERTQRYREGLGAEIEGRGPVGKARGGEHISGRGLDKGCSL